jgi:YD repeat-containing protein
LWFHFNLVMENGMRVNSFGRLVAQTLAIIFALTATPTPSHAQEVGVALPPQAKSPQPPVAAWNGSYADRIEIQVPGFRGLEPNISLTYDSSRGVRNIPSAGGILGVGWSMGGLSTIERTSGSFAPVAGQDIRTGGHGVPSYGAAGMPPDGFALDGSELIACTVVANPSSTPSCAVPVAAGQLGFATRIENFERIRQVTASNTWEVAGKTGIKSIYTSLEGSDPTQTFRWHLASVIDRRGNHVDYTWSCNTTFECTISSIKYFNQASATAVSEISFITEARPDVITYASGKDIRSITQRIKAIDIKSVGTRLRAYGLTYETSVSTGLSRLKQVQQFGRDASVSAAGVVTGITSLPPFLMVYANAPDATGKPTFAQSSWYDSSFLKDLYEHDQDFNGDHLAPDIYSFGGGAISYNAQGNPTTYSCYEQLRLADGTANPPFQVNRTFIAGFTGCGASAIGRYDLINKTPSSSRDHDRELLVDHDWDGDGILDKIWISDVSTTSTNSGGNTTTTKGPRTLEFWAVVYSQATGIGSRLIYSVTSQQHDPNGFDAGVVLAGDFSGDGKSDFLTRSGKLWLSTATSASSTNVSMPAFPTIPSQSQLPDFNSRVDPGDFNGDGKLDLIQHWFAAGSWHAVLYIAKGTGFVAQPEQIYPWALNFDTSGWLIGDANGDGMSDVVVVKPTPNTTTSLQIYTFLSQGKSLSVALPAIQSVSNMPNVLQSGFSGSLANAGCTGNGVSVTCSYTRLAPQILSGEFNGDGRLDLVIPTMSPPTTVSKTQHIETYRNNVIFHSFGGGFSVASTSISLPYVDELIDANGDGLTDVFQHAQTKIGRFAHITNGPIPDLLTSIKQPLGGVTSISYKTSAGLPSTVIPFIMQVVKSLTVDDGRGQVTTTDFDYAGGAWNADERTFLGFRTITATLPANAGEAARPQVRSTYQQNVGCEGRVSMVENLDSAGAVLSATLEGYTVDTSAPFTCTNSSTQSKTYAGSSAKTVKLTRVFDLYGNVTTDYDYGNFDVTGDEVTTYHYFYPNTAEYLVSCPAYDDSYAGISGASRIGLHLNYFDGATSYTAPPASRCEPTLALDWISAAAGYATTSRRYDAYGNVLTTTDAMSNVSTNTYEPTTQLFVTATQSPIATLSTKTEWDTVCGVPTKSAGFNGTLAQTPQTGEVATTSYDALCRPVMVITPGNHVSTTSYVNIGNPPDNQYITSFTTPHGGQVEQSRSDTFLDGFGRSWKSFTTGAVLNTRIVAETRFTNRGEVAQQSAPYDLGGTPQWTTYAYDQLDRLVTATNPDATVATLAYALAPATSTDILEVTSTGETGHIQKYSLDADAKLVKRVKMKAATPLLTEYRRDLLGRIVSVIDPQLNSWAYAYDALGRRTSVSDPDLGNWSYTYDAAGRLVTQTDAKLAVTSLTYDALSRVKTKTVTAASTPTETTTNTYDEARASFFNLDSHTQRSRRRHRNPAI